MINDKRNREIDQRSERKNYKYYVYTISFISAEQREQFTNKINNIKMKTGKPVSTIMMELLNK